MASVSWTQTTSGSWTTPSAWNTGADPLTGDDVLINTQNTSLTVTYATGTLNLNSLATGSADTFDVTGGTLGLVNGYNLQGALMLSGGLLRLVAGNAGQTLSGNITQSGGALLFANGASAVGGVINQTGGTITIAHGVLVDGDTGSLSGTIAGGGQLDFSANGTTILQSGLVLSVAAVDVAAGTVFLNENLSYGHNFSLFGTLDLNGFRANLTGKASLDGDLNGGTLNASGGGHLSGLLLDNGAVLNVASSMAETSNITLGGSTGTGTLDILAAGTLRLAGNVGIAQGNSAGFIANAGTIIKTAGSPLGGSSVIQDTITNTGVIDAAVGNIVFAGPGGGAASSIAGTLEGAGTIAFAGGVYDLGTSTTSLTLASAGLLFENSVNATLATALSYGGDWQQTGGLLLLENNLTLSGETAMAGGELKGTATITDNGALTLGQSMDLEGNLSFVLNGAVTQTGAINLGQISDSVDRATLTAGNTWNLEGNSSISGGFGTITNLGTFVKLDGAQTAVVQSDVINSGTLLVDSGTLALTGQGTLGGFVGGNAVLDLSGQFTLAAGLNLSVGELILDQPSQTNDIQASLAGNLTYAGNFAQEGGTLALNGNTLTLGSTSSATSFDTGAIQGLGTVQVNGAATIIGVSLTQGGKLQFNGATEQTGNVYLSGGTAPVVSIGAKSVYSLDNGVSIGGVNNSVIGTVSLAGTLVATGAGTTTIAATVVDTGAIQISHGQMTFLGPLTGTGLVTLSAGGALNLETTTASSTGITFGAGGGLLYLQNPGDYAGTIGGFASGDSVELGGFGFITPGGLTSFAVNGSQVTIQEAGNGPSLTLNFSTTQTATSLMLGQGPHGGLSLIHI